MLVTFTKMHALGNDFVMIDNISNNIRLHTAHLKKLANRKLGVGCDQIIILDPPITRDADFYYRNYNADGTEAEQCGNGARCAAQFFYDLGLTDKLHLKAHCLAGPVEIFIEDKDQIKINMGTAQKSPQQTNLEISNLNYSKTVELVEISIGNPHAIIKCDKLDDDLVENLGQLISKHPYFPKGTNVGFVKYINNEKIRMRVYERGVGETLACGSGACAAVLAGQFLGILGDTVEVIFEMGSLIVTTPNTNKEVYLKGPINKVFTGRFRI